MASLAETRSAIARVNTGKNANEDGWMTMWCNANWGDLLQPAPLSIALLGSIMVISASTDDFSLINTDDDVPYNWQYAKFPGSFKTCLMQMVNEGYTAFGTAHQSMTRIQNATSQLPDVIKTAVYTIVRGNPHEVQTELHTGTVVSTANNIAIQVSAFLPDQIQSALDLANICALAAKESEEAFHGIQNLAGELVVACTYQVGTSEQKLAANQTQLAILDERRKSEEERVRFAKETNERLKKSFDDAEGDFHSAVKNVPTGWDIVGMQAVESLTQLAASAANLVVGVATINRQAMTAGLGLFQRATGGKRNTNAPPTSPQSTQPNAASITDPAIHEVSRGTNDSTSGGMYVQLSLSTIKDRLDPSKPISAQLIPIMDNAVTLVKGIMAVVKSARGSKDAALDKYKPQVASLVTDCQQLVMRTNLILQQPGTVGSGPGTPPTPAETSSSAAKLAVENAKFQVDQTRANLEASRTAYNNAASQLLEQQEQIGKTIAHLTSLSLTNAGIKAMLPVLTKAVGAFITLQAQFSQISQFFDSVVSLLADVLQPSVQRWATTMENTATLGGVKIGDLARQLIYTQMMVPLKVSMLSEKIATVYLDVSNRYIMPAQRSVGGMMEFTDDTSEKGRAALKASLERKQLELQKQSNDASKQISALVAADQKKFVRAIDQRLDGIKSALQNVLPSVTQPVPTQLEEVTQEHVDQYTEMRETDANENPMFNDDDLM
ncbi:hypothetical protein BC629DRAFT_1591020 [Irpex lacteus]|nr:hypothetical protein BC629DRAFT_1591020 [Irpex lacteus]